MARRMALLMAGVVLLVLAASVVIHSLSARDALRQGLHQRSQDAAATLAAALSLQPGGLDAMRALLTAPMQQGRLRKLELWSTDGELLFSQETPDAPGRAPAWFVQLGSLSSEPASAVVTDGARVVASLRLESRQAWVLDALWDASMSTARLLAGLALLAALLAAWMLGLWLRPLRATVAQAQALEQGRFVDAQEPRMPELQRLTRSMNTLVRRMREVFAAQADQVQVLQRQAQLDAVTGLPLRRTFLGRLQSQLAEPGGPGVALILVRVLALESLNQRLGHEATDRLLATASGLLLAYVERVPGTFAGRLNGSDFGLCLPVAGVAEDTAQSLQAALVAAPALHVGGAQFVVGAVDELDRIPPGAALAAADAALAQAESEGGLAVQRAGTSLADPAGARAWREQIASALAEGRVRLAEHAVLGPDGRLLHLECPLRVQLSPGQEYHAASRWLALARRSRLLPQVDLAALELALQACAQDGRVRAVHVALASLQTPGFVAEVASRLEEAPQVASCLRLESAVPGLNGEFTSLGIAAARWRECGAQVGVEHAGAMAQQLMRLGEVGIRYVKLDARHLRGLAADAAVRAYAQSLVTLIHGLGAQALADGIDTEDDWRALWALGFDGATGPAVQAG